MLTSDPMPENKKIILRHAARANPQEEICGFLVEGWFVASMRNVSSDPRQFAMDNGELLDFYRKWDRRIIGVYHSHPDGREEPSNVDVEHAPQGMRYWIITPDDVIEWDMRHDPPRRVA